MNKRLLTVFSCCLLFACVQAPPVKQGGHALLWSNYPVIELNGEEIEPLYSLDIEEGENTLVIRYKTYQYDYDCSFSLLAVAGNRYEVTDQENQAPLTLYRWVKKNGLWAMRRDKTEPEQCVRVHRP